MILRFYFPDFEDEADAQVVDEPGSLRCPKALAEDVTRDLMSYRPANEWPIRVTVVCDTGPRTFSVERRCYYSATEDN